MKVLVGGPGTLSGLTLRLGQCLFAAASIWTMVTALGFTNYTAFCCVGLMPEIIEPKGKTLVLSSNSKHASQVL